jgi:hypothetical protein
MDGQIEILIRGWVALLVPSGLLVTLAALGLEELFSTVLERFLQSIHDPRKNLVGNTYRQ